MNSRDTSGPKPTAIERQATGARQPAGTPLVQIQDVTKRFDGVTAVDSVTLDIRRNELFAILGSSGCGKTTLLRMLAGFEEPTSGRILIDGVDMTHAAALRAAGQPDVPVLRSVPAHDGRAERRLRTEEGARARRRRSASASRRCWRWSSSSRSRSRKPDKLSGGEQQRVALARALVKRPKLLLLDEPLAALDKKLREHTQFELCNLQYQLGTTFVVVTHDQDEAMTLASRIAVMAQGRIAQVGTPGEVYEYPANRYVADFVGNINLIEGRVTARAGRAGVAALRGARHASSPPLCDEQPARGHAFCVAVRPEKITISRKPPDGHRPQRAARASSGIWATSATSRCTGCACRAARCCRSARRTCGAPRA